MTTFTRTIKIEYKLNSPTWKAAVTNTLTGETTTRIGFGCPVELVAFNALKAAEENTPAAELPDKWTIEVSIMKGA